MHMWLRWALPRQSILQHKLSDKTPCRAEIGDRRAVTEPAWGVAWWEGSGVSGGTQGDTRLRRGLSCNAEAIGSCCKFSRVT